MLEDADISYIAARYSPPPPPLLSGRECEDKWVGGGEEVIEAECSDPAACTGIRQNTVQASLSNTLLQNTVKASSPNTLVLFGSGGTAAELPFGTSARSQNTLIGPNTTQQTGQGSPTHTGTIKKSNLRFAGLLDIHQYWPCRDCFAFFTFSSNIAHHCLATFV